MLAPPLYVRILAWVCRVCPVCIVRRRFPASSFAKTVKKFEQSCPFCRAYEITQLSRSKQQLS